MMEETTMWGASWEPSPTLGLFLQDTHCKMKSNRI